MSIEPLQLTTCPSLNNLSFKLNQNTKSSLLMARFEKVLGVSNIGLEVLIFFMFCTSPGFTESTVTCMNLSYLMKTINVYTSMSKPFSMLMHVATLFIVSPKGMIMRKKT